MLTKHEEKELTTMSIMNYDKSLENNIKKEANGICTSNKTCEAEKEDVASPKKFTCNQKIALGCLAVVDFMSFCSMSIMAPFFPKEASAKGMSESMSGFVFSFYALVMFLSSPVFGKIVPKVGVTLLFSIGIVLSGTCSIIFGLLQYVHSYNTFTILSFVVRGMEALGASAYSTAGYVLVVDIFPENVGAIRGILETFVGLGMSAGPAIGGFLFDVGGFGLPFYVVGVITMVIAPVTFALLPRREGKRMDTKSGSLLGLCKIPAVMVVCFIIMVVSITWSFLDPTLEPHLRKFELSTKHVGLIFLLMSAMYGVFCPIWGWCVDRLPNFWCMMSVGLTMSGISLLFLGPSPILAFLKDSIWLNIFSLSSLGIFVAMSLMPTFQGLFDKAIEGGLTDSLGTQGVIAGMWSCVYSLGEVVGPAVGGLLLQNYGFPTTATCIAILNIATAMICTTFFLTRRQPNTNNDPTVTTNENGSYTNKDISVITLTEKSSNDIEDSNRF